MRVISGPEEARLIFGAVREEVVRLTDGKQEPYVTGSLGSDAIFLSRSQSPRLSRRM